MTLAAVATRPVTYLRWTETGTDDYNNPTYDWVADGSTTDVYLEQVTEIEVVTGENTQIGEWLLVDPNPDAGLTGRDRVDVDGDVFRVDGPPWVAWTRRGEHHMEARLRYVEP